MNYPCPHELAHLPDGASSHLDDSAVFADASGAYIVECILPHAHMCNPVSARFWETYAFRAGWGNKARLEALQMAYGNIRIALAAMGK
ncbi:hypothetical protein NE637_08195 [Desulfovibrio desulfuricans]|uniref:hypothetical protein n=1 Tax=Desulfovibrio desulfuricans TaxID=876 RepID=UPI00210AEE9B|nr:hypothetical protein [Desulfovibrio desulfuricans]MCQ4861127.1 hypothetical protein [Desulfovibrio desulfuricans]